MLNELKKLELIIYPICNFISVFSPDIEYVCQFKETKVTILGIYKNEGNGQMEKTVKSSLGSGVETLKPHSINYEKLRKQIMDQSDSMWFEEYVCKQKAFIF
jgi:hypothetical protein